MGLNIDREHFDPSDFHAFSGRLRDELSFMRELFARPDFGVGQASIGAELELHLVNRELRPAPVNQAVQASANDPRVDLELNRFNLEINALPTALAGQPFAAMRAEFESALSTVRDAAGLHHARIAMMGILPTLRADDLVAESRTPLKRYAALARQLRALRGESFELDINGREPLKMRFDDVTLEGACTSWQLHLRVNPADFAVHYNAAQLATGPVLAVSGNAPLFLGHRLWDETRIATFKQAVDPRIDRSSQWRHQARVSLGSGWVREGALELFAQSVALHAPILPVLGKENVGAVLTVGRAPKFEHLRLHHGTVWSWNRAVYDAVDGSIGPEGAHLRIEQRAMAAGPTLTDMLANSAFSLGLTLGLAATADEWLPQMPFEYARHNLYRGAEKGLRAKLLWPSDASPSPALHDAAELVVELLPIAAKGLTDAGVEANDYEPLLAVIEARARSGRTGAHWQRQRLAHHEQTQALDVALAAMLGEYLERSASDEPVHTW